MSTAEHRITTFDGLSLYCRDYGAGADVVLCLHGLTRNSKDFASLAQHLAERRRVLAPDMRGRGKSERDPNWPQYLPPTYVRDVWSLLDSLGVERVAVIGTSMGGLMAMIMADQQPERLRGVVLNDVGPEVPPEAVGRILEYVGRIPAQPDWEAAVRTVRENYGLAYPEADDAFWAHQARLAWRERPDGTVVPDHDPAIGDALRQAGKSAPFLRFLQRLGMRRVKGVNLDPWDNFRAMTMPVLVLRGEHSDVLTAEILAKMRRGKPKLRTVTVPGVGHAPTLDEPAAREAIDDFLEGLMRP